jgi:hypothetical protein
MQEKIKPGEARVNCARLQEKHKLPLELFLDAIALGLNDHEVAAVTGLKLAEVKKFRQEVGGVGSTLDLTHKKDICIDAASKKDN